MVRCSENLNTSTHTRQWIANLVSSTAAIRPIPAKRSLRRTPLPFRASGSGLGGSESTLGVVLVHHARATNCSPPVVAPSGRRTLLPAAEALAGLMSLNPGKSSVDFIQHGFRLVPSDHPRGWIEENDSVIEGVCEQTALNTGDNMAVERLKRFRSRSSMSRCPAVRACSDR